tara:strand:- start:4752 stop:7889 length:3138 start_codon:yes stop_codon:yes gene_type:complete
MRRGSILVLVLIFPLASGLITNVEMPEIKQNLGYEIIIDSKENQWTQSMWDDLEQYGLAPLRLLSDTELLVWKTDLSVEKLDGFDFYNGHNTEWRSPGIGLDGFRGEVRVVFEPNLPAYASEYVINSFSSLGFGISNDLEDYNSIIPHRELLSIGNDFEISTLFEIEGVLWIEPVLSTTARNLQAASLMATGEYMQTPHWSFGLNGSGVILGIADSGVDLDHACFRNATSIGAFGSNGSDAIGPIGEQHRKILAINNSIDSADTMGHINFRHGTHTAGSLACFDVYDYRDGSIPSNGSSMAHSATMVVQDIVSAEGWVPPENVSELLSEAAIFGSIIHSNSWGDDTTEYTARSGEFDSWALQMPWSLAFIAPGNTGGALLEPANARNVAAIGASTKSESPEKWPSSSIGPTQSGNFGIFALAPGVSIQSAKADGINDSYNDDLRSSSGTSMSTPTAASFAGVIQQMVQDGWFVGSNEPLNDVNLASISPEWANLGNNSILLGEGFTPSGPLLKALLSVSATGVGDSNNYSFRNYENGFGVLNLSELIDFNTLNNGFIADDISPTPDIWIHDSFRLVNNTPTQWLEERTDGGDALDDLASLPWDGSGAIGPFLASGQNWTKRLVPNGDDITFSMSFNAAPEPYLVDDLQLVAKMSNGYSAVGGLYDGDGYSSWFNSTNDLDDDLLFPKNNETTTQIKISASDLQDVEWIDIEVRARYISPGPNSGYIGLGGDRVGFALVSKGVIRDSTSWEDSDGDGLANILDSCPNEDPTVWDSDNDGCIDDSDGDGIKDPIDICLYENSTGFDANQDGCIDDSDGDGVGDDLDVCPTIDSNPLFPVDSNGCRPVDRPPQINAVSISGIEDGVWGDDLVISWSVSDDDNDFYKTGAKLLLHQNSSQSSYFSINDCNFNFANQTDPSGFSCNWTIPNDLPLFDISGKEMHVQIYVQSLNQSPEAYISTLYLDDNRNFSSEWTNPILEVENKKAVKNEPWNVGQNRAIVWGVIGIIGMGILLSRIWRDNMQNNGQFGVKNNENGNYDKKYSSILESE